MASLSINTILPWARLNGIELNGVTIQNVGSAGLGIKVQTTMDDSKPLITIPRDIVLSQETIEAESKSDSKLKEVLEAVCPFSISPRGAIMVYLVIQLAKIKAKSGIGHLGTWATYLSILSPVPVPSCWTEDSLELLCGTSLEAATSAKLDVLEKEFKTFKEKTENIKWCQDAWWSDDSVTFEFWRLADAWFRSRMLDLPNLGVSMVPVIDFCNHATASNARYDVDDDGNAILVSAAQLFSEGTEVTINYGKEKSAAEMLFSYGFMEQDRETAGRLILDLGDIQGMGDGGNEAYDMAKMHLLSSRPSLILTEREDGVNWSSDAIWLMCVNQEDGLSIRITQENDGSKHLEAFFNGQKLIVEELKASLEESPKWPLFQLRATTLVQQRIQVQLQKLSTVEAFCGETGKAEVYDQHIWFMSTKLQKLEKVLLEQTIASLESQAADLFESAPVQEYFLLMQDSQALELNDDEDDDEDADLT